MNAWKTSDTLFSPKLFKFMLMVPTTKEELNDKTSAKVHEEIQEVSVTNNEIHPNDLVGSVLTDFFAKGGSSKFAHIFSKFDDMKNSFKRWIMEVNHVEKKPLALTHGGKHLTSLKANNLNHCLLKNSQLGVKITYEDDNVNVNLGDKVLTFTEEEFSPFETFLSDVCYLVEYCKLHYNDFGKNLMMHHLESYLAIANSEHKDDFLKVLYNGVETMKNVIEKVYGTENVKFLVTKFMQAVGGSVPIVDHSRILQAEDGTNENLRLNDDDYAWSIRLIFGILFLFLIIYVCVYLYRMEVHKDSLIYAKFISTKRDKKNA